MTTTPKRIRNKVTSVHFINSFLNVCEVTLSCGHTLYRSTRKGAAPKTAICYYCSRKVNGT